MTSQPTRVILTYDDYARLPDDGRRYELYEGEISMAAAPNIAHQRVVGSGYTLLRAHVRRHNLGDLFVAPTDVVLSNLSVVQPDLVFVARARQANITPQNVRGAPDLVIEVLSPFEPERDLEIKYQLYARYGVSNYWLFDPRERHGRALPLTDGSYREATKGDGGAAFSVAPFPDLVIPLSEVWE